ncbi:MAG: site-specific DNA-methyltransferase [Phycisphaerae bacterium]|nr:site-specific DNA-methyltransferase [Phycisphaerae bacterium]
MPSAAEQDRARSEVRLGDWLELAAGLAPASIDLLYADPPFNTGKPRSTPPNAGRRGRRVRTAFPDRWGSMEAYLAWLGERLSATLPALKPSACVLIHCDDRASHRIRVLLDDLFGPDRFVNHLAWSYGLGGSSPRRFARKHDDILLYCVDPARYWFEAPRVAATSRRMEGGTKKATDVLSIPSLNNMASERTGYPTQKPLALLDLLVRACCPPAGLVLDPVCGSGTTVVAAARSGRRALGFDVNPAAVRLARRRLA